jgi:sulfur carrier protein ThiS
MVTRSPGRGDDGNRMSLNLMITPSKCWLVKIDDILVQKKDYASTSIPDGADVKVIHLISGG